MKKVKTEKEVILMCRRHCSTTHGLGIASNLTNKHHLLLITLKAISNQALFGGIEYDYERELMFDIVRELEYYPNFEDIE